MRIPSLLVLALLAVVALPVSLAEARPADGDIATVAAKQQAAKGKAKARGKAKAKARKSCRKGYVRKSVKVKRKGRMVRVKRCRKKKQKQVAKPRPVTPPPPAAPAPPTPGPPGPLFEAPGVQLTGAAAEPFFKRYLHGSRFTDCPAGWPSCPSEQRFSHFANGRFYTCQLPLSAGASVPPDFSYVWQDTIVNADGSWSFNAEVTGGPRPAFYDWQVAVDGTVTGTQHVPGPGGPKQIGPLRYVSGGSDCTA